MLEIIKHGITDTQTIFFLQKILNLGVVAKIKVLYIRKVLHYIFYPILKQAHFLK